MVSLPAASSARSHLIASVSTTASSKPRAMSARTASDWSLSRQASSTWVLSPEKLKSRPGRSVIGRAKRKRPEVPCVASAASCGPPGYGSPISLAVLSKASPAASSRVSPSRR
ncbi:hypothetical protein NB713_003242 [Xanthomonas sacchari]|nr:hypothetical protein [Xanthomonas sacchari]